MAPGVTTTTMGWRDHIVCGYTECWCKPTVEVFTCGDCGGEHMLRTHKDVTLTRDTQPRMTVFSR